MAACASWSSVTTVPPRPALYLASWSFWATSSALAAKSRSLFLKWPHAIGDLLLLCPKSVKLCYQRLLAMLPCLELQREIFFVCGLR